MYQGHHNLRRTNEYMDLQCCYIITTMCNVRASQFKRNKWIHGFKVQLLSRVMFVLNMKNDTDVITVNVFSLKKNYFSINAFGSSLTTYHTLQTDKKSMEFLQVWEIFNLFLKISNGDPSAVNAYM